MTQTEITPFGTGQPILTLTDAAAKQARKLMDKARKHSNWPAGWT